MRGRRTVTFNSSSPPWMVNVLLILPVFVSRMERPAYWTCWTRRELNCRPKMLMRKAIPTAHSLPFYCTNRSLADGRKLFLRLREAEDPETCAHFNEESDGHEGCSSVIAAAGARPVDNRQLDLAGQRVSCNF